MKYYKLVLKADNNGFSMREEVFVLVKETPKKIFVIEEELVNEKAEPISIMKNSLNKLKETIYQDTAERYQREAIVSEETKEEIIHLLKENAKKTF